MPQFKTIVLTTDLSENARAAAPHALELAGKYGGIVHLLYVFEDLMFTGVMVDGSMGYDPTPFLEQAESTKKAQLSALSASLAATAPLGSRLDSHFIKGNAHAEILKFAADKHADCIVMATHGRSGFSHLLFGSIAEKVVRTSPCPVLTIRPHHLSGTEKSTAAATEIKIASPAG